jgi:hypothetical protein
MTDAVIVVTVDIRSARPARDFSPKKSSVPRIATQEAISCEIFGACLFQSGDKRAASRMWLTQPSRRLLMNEL